MLHVLALTAALGAVTPEAILATAQSYVGRPYHYGGEGVGGFDCSGFVQMVFNSHAIQLPRRSADQARVGKAVAWDGVQAGDLLFFTDRPGNSRVTHVGIAVDATHMIHASTGRAEILVDPLDLEYYVKRRIAVRRVLTVDPVAPRVAAVPPAPEPEKVVVKERPKSERVAKSRGTSRREGGGRSAASAKDGKSPRK